MQHKQTADALRRIADIIETQECDQPVTVRITAQGLAAEKAALRAMFALGEPAFDRDSVLINALVDAGGVIVGTLLFSSVWKHTVAETVETLEPIPVAEMRTLVEEEA